MSPWNPHGPPSPTVPFETPQHWPIYSQPRSKNAISDKWLWLASSAKSWKSLSRRHGPLVRGGWDRLVKLAHETDWRCKTLQFWAISKAYCVCVGAIDWSTELGTGIGLWLCQSSCLQLLQPGGPVKRIAFHGDPTWTIENSSLRVHLGNLNAILKSQTWWFWRRSWSGPFGVFWRFWRLSWFFVVLLGKMFCLKGKKEFCCWYHVLWLVCNMLDLVFLLNSYWCNAETLDRQGDGNQIVAGDLLAAQIWPW